MQWLDFQISFAVTVFLNGQLAYRDFRHRRREGPAPNVAALFAPMVTTDALGLQVIERRQLVQRPIGIHRCSALEVRPQNRLGFFRSEEPRLSPGTEAVIIYPGRKFLSAFQGVADGRFAILVTGKREIGSSCA